jgi:DNA-binding XRE family transcriptional regulator
MEKLESAAKYLRSLGVHVTIRPGDHEKFVLVDENIFWAGSLNLLSWFDTREWLRRAESRADVQAMIERYNLLPCEYCSTKPKIGELLRARREMFGLKQEEVAKRAGVSRRTVVNLEAGERMHMDLVERICAVLDLSLHVSPTYAEQASIRLSTTITSMKFVAAAAKTGLKKS